MGLSGARTRFPAVLSLAVSAAILAAPHLAYGQVRITGGTVTDGTREPVEGVVVTALDSAGAELATGITTDDGRFALQVEATSPVRLRAERIGYETVLTPSVDLGGYRSVVVEIRLAPDVVPVAPLAVVATRRREPSPIHEGFHHRRERGFGLYITREEIERRAPPQVTDLLRSMPGVRVSSTGRGTHGIVTTNRGNSSFAGACPAQIYVDDFHVNKADGRTFRIDDVVSPNDVEGIEVYRGLSTVPAQFLSPQADCGVIVIWTRRGPGR